MLSTSGAGTATTALEQSETCKMVVDVQKQGRNGTMKDKETRTGMLGSYEVTGWRYSEHASWRVKVWRAGRPNEWIGYTVTAGTFELKSVAQAHKDAVLHVIGEWEAE
jgi:hypothetical protein